MSGEVELYCCYCGEECWHKSRNPTIEFLCRVAEARGWVRRDDLDGRFGPPPWYICDGCQRQSRAMQAAQD